MDAALYEDYMEGALTRFATDYAKGDEVPLNKALAMGRDHMAGLLPDGMRTRGHHFRTMTQDGQPVGTLWFAEQLDETPPRVYIFDITVDEAQRGRGLGTRALAALDEEARALGAEEIMLSVFFHNTDAVRLYERLGFTPRERGKGGMRMAKSV